ncbi:hypothetical protein HHL22_08515 [Hymenobacter sp. RP-2-7]|uniref:Erythromycin esterase family protein n=1 Tax=Hymenobacter polaris TaxID=2682546 RepID=A0A7Y0ADC5_9BACT|nr:hypothetical protein [Hymenobacter polaris]NML65244.1 hypothetical protein [Hymenobacter polaris]
MPSFLRILTAALALTGLIAQPAAAQDSTLTRLARQHLYPLQASGSSFSGPGWDRLLTDVRQSQFVLVGEYHGLAQIPVFVAAVAREFKPAVYVGELDPYVAQKVTELAAQPGEPTAYLRQYPSALCFASMAEEYGLLRQLRAQGTRLIGIDQVFAASAGPLYAQLARLVKRRAARTYLQHQAARYQAQDQLNQQQHNQYYALTKQTPGSIDSLLTLTKAESPAAQQLAQAYATSYHIYTGRGGNHQHRLDLMKRNLLGELQPYQTATGLQTPPMLLKFGGVHLGRGVSPIRFGEFYDVGNLVQNLADVQHKKSLHVLVLGRQGYKLATLNPTNTEKLSVPYTEADYDDELPIKAFANQACGPAWSMFDLRPLRDALTEGKLLVPNQSLQRTIMGYDYLVVIPETTASHAM